MKQEIKTAYTLLKKVPAIPITLIIAIILDIPVSQYAISNSWSDTHLIYLVLGLATINFTLAIFIQAMLSLIKSTITKQ